MSKSKAARPLNLAKLQETKSTIRFSAKLFRPASRQPKAHRKDCGGWIVDPSHSAQERQCETPVPPAPLTRHDDG